MIRIGLLGASAIAPYAIIEPARARPDVQVVAVAARDPARARAYALQHSLGSSAVSYAELIARADVDLVYVGLPPSLHQEWTIRALEAGKAVLCEKPFALNAREAREMTAASAACGRPLLEAFHYRFHSTMHRTLAIVRDELGPLRSMHAVVAGPGPRDRNDIRWQASLGGGALMDLGCYGIHALRTLAACEPVVRGAQAAVSGGVDAATQADLCFESCPTARLECSFLAPEFVNSLRIAGERGALEVEGFMLPQYGGRLRLTRDGLEREERLPAGTTFAAQLAHVVDVLEGRAAPLTGGADAVANMLVQDAIRAACRAHTPAAGS
jgi:predicted dehydrogenase